MHKRFLAICFDEEQARLQGLPVNTLYLLLLVLTAVSIVLLIQVVGIILVMTMLTIPAAIANLFTSRLSMMMLIAILISCSFAFLEQRQLIIWIGQQEQQLPLLAGLVYVASSFCRFRRRMK